MNLKRLKMASFALLAAMSLVACGGKGNGKNQAVPGVTGPNVSVVNGNVLLSMVFNDISVQGGATIPIPKFPNSSLSMGPDFQSSGTLLVLTVSVKDFLGNQAVILDPKTLPGGRPLPTVAAGALPAIAVQIPQLFNTVLYLGPQVIGFFVPLKGLDLAGSILSFTFYGSDGKEAGTLSIVGQDASKQNAGILLLLNSNLLGIGTAPPAPVVNSLN